MNGKLVSKLMARTLQRSTRSLNGRDLKEIFSAATLLLERNAEAVNALNVFPVPDGDTGTNMLLTMRSVIQEAQQVQGQDAHLVATTMAKGALMGARGNSGVILSQFFRGLADSLKACSSFQGRDLAQALEAASKAAYKAVSSPVEGTMLTVLREAAQAAGRESSNSERDPVDIWRAASAAAKQAVEQTPLLLPILREAGVVDAGGLGVSILLEGALCSLEGKPLDSITSLAPTPLGLSQVSVVSQQFLSATQEQEYGYCTQIMIRGENLNPDALREKMSAMADSTVVVGDESAVKVHVHTKDPGPIISYAVTLGTLHQVKIENIDEQHEEFQRIHRPPALKPQGILALVCGKGFDALFRNLGASTILLKGPILNPSVSEILEAVKQLPAERVAILPNNANDIPAAQQACQISQKPCVVLSTTTIPEGVAAVLAFSEEREWKENLEAMSTAFNNLVTIVVTPASRDSRVQGQEVSKGEFIALEGRSLVARNRSRRRVLQDVLRIKGTQGSLVTLYWGESLEAEARRVETWAKEVLPGVDIDLVCGGHPLYEYVISVE